MRTLPENIARGQIKTNADQGRYFQVKPEQNRLLFNLLTELSTKALKKTFFHLRQFRFLFSVLRSIH